MDTKALPQAPWHRFAPWLKAYYVVVAAVAAAITAGFVGFMILLWIVVQNFNLLGWTE